MYDRGYGGSGCIGNLLLVLALVFCSITSCVGLTPGYEEPTPRPPMTRVYVTRTPYLTATPRPTMVTPTPSPRPCPSLGTPFPWQTPGVSLAYPDGTMPKGIRIREECRP